MNSLFRWHSNFVFLLLSVKGRISAEHVRKNESRKGKILFGPNALLNNKYWSLALKERGFKVKSVSWEYFDSINKKEDFDEYLGEIRFSGFEKFLFGVSNRLFGYRKEIHQILLYHKYAKEYEYLVFSFQGWLLGDSRFSKKEAKLLKLYGNKTILFPYGSDFIRYSDLLDHSYLYGLLMHYPNAAKHEVVIKEKIEYWKQHADGLFPGYLLDRIGRLDSWKVSNITIDNKGWKPDHSKWDNMDEVVIVHSPNHRGIKGTEFITECISELKMEGYKINFILLEKTQNDVVKDTLSNKAHILIEQLILSGYGLNGVEGMAAGCVVISNLEDDRRLRAFRRYSYLNECPIISGTPENIKDILKTIISNRDLMKQLAIAGVQYVDKYYSFPAFSEYFEQIVRSIETGDKTALMGYYHPLALKNLKNNRINHPLVDNKLPLA